MSIKRYLAAVAFLSCAFGAAFAQNLTLGTKLELNTLDPHFFNAFPTGSSHSTIYEGLVFNDENQKLQPALATSPSDMGRFWRRWTSLMLARTCGSVS